MRRLAGSSASCRRAVGLMLSRYDVLGSLRSWTKFKSLSRKDDKGYGAMCFMKTNRGRLKVSADLYRSLWRTALDAEPSRMPRRRGGGAVRNRGALM